MPQFDFYSFSSQVVWSQLGIIFFYFFILKFYLAPIIEILKFRQKLFSQVSGSAIISNKKSLYTFFF